MVVLRIKRGEVPSAVSDTQRDPKNVSLIIAGIVQVLWKGVWALVLGTAAPCCGLYSRTENSQVKTVTAHSSHLVHKMLVGLPPGKKFTA